MSSPCSRGLDPPDPERALDALWLLTGFAAYDDLTRGRGLTTAGAAALLSDLADQAVHRPAAGGLSGRRRRPTGSS